MRISSSTLSNASVTLFLTGILGGALVQPKAQNLDDVMPMAERKFVVAIAAGKGDTVGSDDDRLAKDLEKGAEDARGKDSRFEIVFRNDENNDLKAKANAVVLQLDPRVLAVVGHMVSSATRAAAEVYAEAGIPLLMPTATGARAPYPISMKGEIVPEMRLSNAFRLPASDDRAQVPTIAYVISKLGPRKVHLIADREDPQKAQEYSMPLIDQLNAILQKKNQALENPSDLTLEDLSVIADEIKRNHTAEDLIVFAGYAELAKKLLDALELKYTGQAQSARPKLLFTEGASNIEEQPRGFTVYRTAYRDTARCTSTGESASQKHTAEYTYGFDSISIVIQALNECKAELSRDCVSREIRNKPFLIGSCEYYSFQNGDNILSNYYVFASDQTALGLIDPSVQKGLAAVISPQQFLPFVNPQ